MKQPMTYIILLKRKSQEIWAEYYYGSTADINGRYSGNKINGVFLGPHHNSEVQARLDDPEWEAVWCCHKTFDSGEEARNYEYKHLLRLWPSGKLKDRPEGMLNKTPKDLGWGLGDTNKGNTSKARKKAVKTRRTFGDNYEQISQLGKSNKGKPHVKENGRKAGKSNKGRKMHPNTKEALMVHQKNLNNTKYKCLVTGKVSTAGPLTIYQKKRNIDTKQRVKVTEE